MLSEDRCDVQELFLDDVVVPDVGGGCWQWLTGGHIDSEWLFVLEVLLLDLEESVLSIESRVGSKSTWDNEESISEALNSKLDLS